MRNVFSVSSRGKLGHFFEDPTKALGIAKAGQITDVLDSNTRVQQKLLCFFYAYHTNEICEADPDLFFEKTREDIGSD